MNNEMFTGGNEKPEIEKEDVIEFLKNIKGEPTSKDLERLSVWQKQEEEKCTNSLMLLKLNFEVAKVYLVSGLKNAALDAFSQATDQAEQEGPEANEIYNEAYVEFGELLGGLDKE